MGRVHRITRWVIFITGGLVGLLTIIVLVGPSVRHWQMGRAIAHFERRPTQSRADTLLELLRAHAATDEQGQRALALLLRPKIETRTAYASGRVVTVDLERPFDIGARKFLWSNETITIDGLRATPRVNPNSLGHGPSCLEVPVWYTQPGTYPLELRFQYSVGIERRSRSTTLLSHLHDALPWLIPDMAAWRPSRTYQCDFTVSSEVTIAEDEDAENVQLISSPELDEAMRSAFRSMYFDTETEVMTPAGRRRVTGSAWITYGNLPLAAAFRATLRLPDGREMSVSSMGPAGFPVRAGSSGVIMIDPSNFVVETPGRHKATLVFVPDLNLAYRDPAIKSIWNGTLELPVSFTIDANVPSR